MSSKHIGKLTIIFIFCISCCQSTSASTEDDPAKQLYESAFKLIVEGDYSRAYDQLNNIIAKYPDTVYARFAEDRKQRLERLNLSSIRRKKIDQSGRVDSIVFGTLYSTWLGIGTAILIGADDEKSAAGGMMLGAPAGLLTSLILTRNAKLSDGQSALISYGGYWGTWQGLGWAIVMDESSEEKVIKGAIAGGLLGIIATSALTRKIDISIGDASIINYGALWGTWFSFCIGALLDAADFMIITGDDYLKLVLLGGNVGAIAMSALSSKVEVSLARASLISLGGIIGTLVSGGLLLIVAPDRAIELEEYYTFATFMAGGILGLVSAGYWTRNFDANRIQQESVAERFSWPLSSQYRKIDPMSRQSACSTKGIRVTLVSIQF